jgi:hypothetical protein
MYLVVIFACMDLFRSPLTRLLQLRQASVQYKRLAN